MIIKSIIAIMLLITALGLWVASSRNSPGMKGVLSEKEIELNDLPVGIEVVHAPNPVKAQLRGRSGSTYTWLHDTRGKSTIGDLTVTEFGAFSWHNNAWHFGTIYDRPFNAEEFEEWYSCPDAVLEVDTVYTDPNNYTGSDHLRASKTKWYYIGQDASGKRYKGEAVVDHVAELLEK